MEVEVSIVVNTSNRCQSFRISFSASGQEKRVPGSAAELLQSRESHGYRMVSKMRQADFVLE